MADIVINGATYKDVPSIEVPSSDGGVVEFEEKVSDKFIDRSIVSVENNVSNIGAYAFCNCYALTSVSFPNATNLGIYAFCNCYTLTSVSFPNATNLGIYAFCNCYALTSVSFPNAKAVGNYCFYACENLKKANFNQLNSIDTMAFASSKLTSLAIANKSISSLTNSNAFANTPIASGTGYIYVPSALVES